MGKIWTTLFVTRNNKSQALKGVKKKNKHYKWKIYWVKSIIATDTIHHQRKAVLTPSPVSLQTPYMDYPAQFLQENVQPYIYMIFQKFHPPLPL